MAKSVKPELQPLLKWPGGKSRMIKRLLKEFPKHTNYVEPFIGGGALFFAKPLAEGKNVIADKDRYVIDFYTDVRKGALRKCQGGIKKSRSLFNRSKAKKSACYKIALGTLSFHGNRKTFVGNKGTREGKVMLANKLRKAPLYEKKLRRTYILNRDFEKTMRKFDARDTLHFLDPPWPVNYSEEFYTGGHKHGLSKSLSRYKDTAFDPYHVAKVSKKMRGHVIVIINDSPMVRRAFCKDKAFRCKKIQVSTNIGNRMDVRPNLVIHKKAKSR